MLNLVRNVTDILDILSSEIRSTRPSSSSDSPDSSPLSSDEEYDDPPPSSPRHSTDISSAPLSPLKFKDKHRLLCLRLAPLRRVQADLEARLGSAATELYSTSATSAAPFDPSSPQANRSKEFSVHSTNGWKTALERFRAARRRASNSSSEHKGVLRKVRDLEEEVQGVVAGCREDMRAVWEDRVVREMLARRKVRIEDSAGL